MATYTLDSVSLAWKEAYKDFDSTLIIPEGVRLGSEEIQRRILQKENEKLIKEMMGMNNEENI